MRVISGTLGGRRFNAPKSNVTHPMSEKVRGAIFNKLSSLEGKTVLDAYGGSGALMFEAISHGAESGVIIEKNRQSARTIMNNITDLGISSVVKIITADNLSWSKKNQDLKFDLVLLDPPYDLFDKKAVEKLTKHVNESGIVILSTSGSVESPLIDGVVVVDTRSFGDARLHFYRKSAG